MRRLLNDLGRQPRPKLNAPPLPVEDFCPSDFAASPEEAWEIADIEIELERKAAEQHA